MTLIRGLKRPPAIFSMEFELGGAPFKAEAKDPVNLNPAASLPTKIEVQHFTRAGRELRRIVNMTPHPTAIAELRRYLLRYDLVLEPVPTKT